MLQWLLHIIPFLFRYAMPYLNFPFKLIPSCITEKSDFHLWGKLMHNFFYERQILLPLQQTFVFTIVFRMMNQQGPDLSFQNYCCY